MVQLSATVTEIKTHTYVPDIHLMTSRELISYPIHYINLEWH